MLQHGLHELYLPFSYLQYPQGERSPENGISPLGVICAYFRKVYVAAKPPAFALPAADVSPGVCMSWLKWEAWVAYPSFLSCLVNTWYLL